PPNLHPILHGPRSPWFQGFTTVVYTVPMKAAELLYEEKVEMSFGLRTLLTLIIVIILVTAVVAPVRSDHGRRILFQFSLPMIAGGLLLALLVGIFTMEEVELSEDALTIRYGITRTFRTKDLKRAWSGEFHFSNTGGWGIRGISRTSFVPRFGPAVFLEFDDGRRHKIYGFASEHPERLLRILASRGVRVDPN
ncbi:MAG: hypothetical protein ACYC55_09085, partial [Candidatus Geothermincolia bacterium]